MTYGKSFTRVFTKAPSALSLTKSPAEWSAATTICHR